MKLQSKIVTIAFLSALLIVAKEAFSFIPNVELVTVLLIVYTNTLGLKDSLYISFIFTTVQALIYPPHLWIITYYIIWPLLVLLTHFVKKIKTTNFAFAILGALFGLSFGGIDSFILSFVYGRHTFFPIWLRGIPWDLVHGFSNYLTVLLLYNPIYNNLKKFIN